MSSWEKGGKMADSKYGKYIITDLNRSGENPNAGRTDAPPPDMKTHVVTTDDERPKGAFVTSGGWIWKAYPDNVWARAHTHDYDETVSFFGSNPDDVNDLCGEIEWWMEDEKFLLTKSCTIFVPKGMKHCPAIVKRVDRPIFNFLTGPAGKYERTLVD
jgi:hypothetical protein